MQVIIALVLLALSLGLSAALLYGFWVCGFVGVLLKDKWLMVGAVAIWLIMTYLIFYRLRRLG